MDDPNGFDPAIPTIHRFEFGPLVLRVLAAGPEAALARAKVLMKDLAEGYTVWESGWEELRVYPSPEVTDDDYHEDEGEPPK